MMETTTISETASKVFVPKYSNIPKVGSVHAPCGVTLRVPVKINGMIMSATVDSGSEVTVLHSDMIHQCSIDANNLQEYLLRGAFGHF
jgi:carbonic anhydrase/acetyltransferase-like protein (isoleucine patch superfamily)